MLTAYIKNNYNKVRKTRVTITVFTQLKQGCGTDHEIKAKNHFGVLRDHEISVASNLSVQRKKRQKKEMAFHYTADLGVFAN